MSQALRAVRWLAVKDLAVLRRSPVLVAILVIYPVAIAVMIGVALSSPPGRPKVAVYSGVRAGHGSVTVGGSHIDIGAYTHQLTSSITPVREPSAAAAIAAVRGGRAQAAIIIPADIIAQVQQLVSQGVGNPTIQLVLNDSSPLERDVANAELQRRIDQVQSAISRELLSTALGDLHTVIAGGRLSFAGTVTDLLGLSAARKVVAAAIPVIATAPGGRALIPALQQVINFADIASEGLSFASPVLGQIQSPLTIQRSELTAQNTPTSAYAVAIAISVSMLFLAMLLAAALLALERSEQVYDRLVRGLASPGALLTEKILVGGLAAAVVGLIMSVVVSSFIGVLWGRFGFWVLAVACAGVAFAALGVALGALARDVAAASLLAILVGLPVAFLALVPSAAVSGGLGGVLDVLSFIFPFRAGLDAVSTALNGGSPAIGGPLVHLVVAALVYGTIARVAMVRRDA